MRPTPSDTETILHILALEYPDPRPALHFDTPFQLLIATILSAQCTDERVNQITGVLFADCPTPETIAALSFSQLADYIRSGGLWKNKTRSILATSRQLLEQHGGLVPCDREALMALPGVGRKTANVVLANACGVPAIAVDTHVLRVSNRLGLAQSRSPDETERQLMQRIPKRQWSEAHHWLIFHGRRFCQARKPRCLDCPLGALCPSFISLKPDEKKSKKQDGNDNGN